MTTAELQSCLHVYSMFDFQDGHNEPGILINKYNIAELQDMQVDKLVDIVKKLDSKESHSLTKTLVDRLTNLNEIGLGYLTLNRGTDTLSGGESQRRRAYAF